MRDNLDQSSTMRELSQTLKTWWGTARAVSSQCIIYLVLTLLAAYQGYLLVDEFNNQCDTLVDIFKPTRVQLPAFSLCVPPWRRPSR